MSDVAVRNTGRGPEDMIVDPRAWQVAIALGLATNPPMRCALWASGQLAADDEREARRQKCEREALAAGTSAAWADRESRHAVCNVRIVPTPVPAPWDAAAYLADCARRKVEPGPLPSLEWTGPDGFGWRVDTSENGAHVYIKFTWRTREAATWASSCDEIWFVSDEYGRVDEFPREVVGRIYTLATAAAKVTVP